MSDALRGQWVDMFMALGRPQPPYEAFPDMHPDDIILRHSGVLLTVGDVRSLQNYLLANGAQRVDRMAKIMAQIPEGSPQ